MAPAAPATSPGHDPRSDGRRRPAQRTVSRRALLQLLVGVLVYLRRERVAGHGPPVALARSISLTVNGKRIGTVVATIALNRRLAARLARTAAHGRSDRLLIVRDGTVVGSGQHIQMHGRTV